VARAGKRQGDESLIGHLIAMLHQSGTLVLAEGVETDDELMILMQADVDFVQGFWLGQPKGSVQAACARVPALIDFGKALEAVLAASRSFADTGDLALAAQLVFPIPEARRVFVTDDQGEQTLPSISAPSVPPPPQRLAPLLATTRSNWSRRAYFKHALAAPGRVAMMGPHYSLIDGEDCYTAAVTLEREGKTIILCVDFIPAARSAPSPRRR
jgi:hypothetical protein